MESLSGTDTDTYGCTMAVQDRAKADNAVKKAFIKDSSIRQILNFPGHKEKIPLKK
jgi:hypothetical protein